MKKVRINVQDWKERNNLILALVNAGLTVRTFEEERTARMLHQTLYWVEFEIHPNNIHESIEL